MPPLLLLHVLAGLTGVMAGFAALLLRKGTGPHRRMGLLFAGAMLAMSLSGAYRAAFVHLQPINVLAGLFTAYLVASGWLAARRPVTRLDGPSMLVTLFGASVILGAGYLAGLDLQRPESDGSSIAAAVFGGLTLLGVTGDVRLGLQGPLTGTRRLRRHLWRMGVALLLATFSLFLGTPKRILPAVITGSALQWLPMLAALGGLGYGWVRSRSPRVARVHPAPPATRPAH